MKQGKTGGLFGLTRGLASEDTKFATGAPQSDVSIGATARGLPGGQGVWAWHLPEIEAGPPGSQGGALWHRTQRPGVMDAQALRDHEIEASLSQAWEAGHDAVMLKNYTIPRLRADGGM